MSCWSREEMRKRSAKRPRLIINADDLGLATGINLGIEAGHARGVITSASLMANGRAFEGAVSIAKRLAMDVGVHLVLVEEAPILPPNRVSSLIDESGCMPRDFSALLRLVVTGRVREAEVRAELAAQIERCLDSGLRPSHLDSHQHVHMWPSLLRIVVDLARRYDIPAIRSTRLDLAVESRSRVKGAGIVRAGMVSVLGALGLRAAGVIRRAGLVTTGQLRGVLSSGHLGGNVLSALLDKLPPEVTEIVVHPGVAEPELQTHYAHWGFDWEGELAALERLVPAVNSNNGPALISFRELATDPASRTSD
jgi:chitin disaccharide deacetylase